MNEHIEKRMEDLRQLLDCYEQIVALGLDDEVDFATNSNIFMRHGEVERRRARMVEAYGPDKLSHYYASGDTLALEYNHPQAGVSVIYYDPEVERRLQEVSGGRCRIEDEAIITKKVVCEMGGNE